MPDQTGPAISLQRAAQIATRVLEAQKSHDHSFGYDEADSAATRYLEHRAVGVQYADARDLVMVWLNDNHGRSPEWFTLACLVADSAQWFEEEDAFERGHLWTMYGILMSPELAHVQVFQGRHTEKKLEAAKAEFPNLVALAGKTIIGERREAVAEAAQLLVADRLDIRIY